MASYYSVIQYVPDPVRDERINFGVVTFSGNKIRTRFVNDWWRVERFGQKKIGFLKDFARQLQDAEDGSGDMDEAEIRRIAGRWMNSIQFSEPRGSLLDLDKLLDDVGARFLYERETRQRARDRRLAIGLAADAIGNALEDLGGKQARRLLKREEPVQGKIEPHRFDLAVVNGRPLMAAEGFSFEGQDLEKVAIAVAIFRGVVADRCDR
jgi:hypothetical protein